MKAIHVISWILVVVGGLNWGLLALTGWEIGSLFGGMDTGISKTIYVLVGLAALYELFTHKKGCKGCASNGAGI